MIGDRWSIVRCGASDDRRVAVGELQLESCSWRVAQCREEESVLERGGGGRLGGWKVAGALKRLITTGYLREASDVSRASAGSFI
jgi:hypothetical protein